MVDENEVFEFLDELRESGSTNMFGARPYIVKEFHIESGEAGKAFGKVDANIRGETSRMNLNEYAKMVRYHHEVLNKKCENHISTCLCFDCMTRANSASIIREHKNKFIGFSCKCKECSK